MLTFYIQATEGPMSVIDSEIIYIILLQLSPVNCFIKIISAYAPYLIHESFHEYSGTVPNRKDRKWAPEYLL